MYNQVTIHVADGEMRVGHNLSKPYDPDMVQVQFKTISWMVKHLCDDGDVVIVRLDHSLNTRFNGFTDEEIDELYQALHEAGDAVYDTPIDQAIVDVLMPGLKICQRCGYQWWGRKSHPSTCPRCHSALWDRPRGENEPGPKPKKRSRET